MVGKASTEPSQVVPEVPTRAFRQDGIAGAFPIVMMGVCGAGKTLVGRRLAERLGRRFVEGDDFHPGANVRKMASGVPLTDADRWPWLDALGSTIARADGRGIVASCSALRRRYRERLRSHSPRPILFVLLDVPEPELARRMRERKDHFMPPALLESQLATLEEPIDETGVIRINGAMAIDAIADGVLSHMSAMSLGT